MRPLSNNCYSKSQAFDLSIELLLHASTQHTFVLLSYLATAAGKCLPIYALFYRARAHLSRGMTCALSISSHTSAHLKCAAEVQSSLTERGAWQFDSPPRERSCCCARDIDWHSDSTTTLYIRLNSFGVIALRRVSSFRFFD